jgi:hypothetical protein
VCETRKIKGGVVAEDGVRGKKGVTHHRQWFCGYASTLPKKTTNLLPLLQEAKCATLDVALVHKNIHLVIPLNKPKPL